MKDELDANLKNPQIKALMVANTEEMPDKIQQTTVNHVVADGMLWGRYFPNNIAPLPPTTSPSTSSFKLMYSRIGPCPTCKSYKLFFNGTEYICKGWVCFGGFCFWFFISLSSFVLLVRCFLILVVTDVWTYTL